MDGEADDLNVPVADIAEQMSDDDREDDEANPLIVKRSAAPPASAWFQQELFQGLPSDSEDEAVGDQCSGS